MRFTWASQSERRVLVSNLSVTCTAFVNFTRRIGFRIAELFRKIDEDFGCSVSWNTQPNYRAFDESYTTNFFVVSYDSCFFNMATALLSSFENFFTRLFINLAMRIRALFTQSASTLGLVENKHSGRFHYSQNELVQVLLR